MAEVSGRYEQRRGWLERYFDGTAVEAWARLTADGPVSRIRATVRAGRDQMRAQLLEYLPEDLSGKRVLDAGCGTGAFSVEAARRGADVIGVDLSPTLIDHARERTVEALGEGRVEYRVGDMLDPALGEFDYIVAMDSLIHYRLENKLAILAQFGARCRGRLVFTFAPRTVLLSVMHFVGKLMPHGDRAPSIEPEWEARVRAVVTSNPTLSRFQIGATDRVKSGFYTSQAMLLERSPATGGQAPNGVEVLAEPSRSPATGGQAPNGVEVLAEPSRSPATGGQNA